MHEMIAIFTPPIVVKRVVPIGLLLPPAIDLAQLPPERTRTKRLDAWLEKRLVASRLPVTNYEASVVFGIPCNFLNYWWKRHELPGIRSTMRVYFERPNRRAIDLIIPEIEASNYLQKQIRWQRWTARDWRLMGRVPINAALCIQKSVGMSIKEIRPDFVFLSNFLPQKPAALACHGHCSITVLELPSWN